jgi:hypothetical protein
MGRRPIANPLLDIAGNFDPMNFVNPFWAGDSLDPETIVWRDRAIAAGGTFEADSITIADALIKAIKASTFNDKIKYLIPYLGGNLATARVPLRDSLNVGIAGNLNSAFVDGDFSQSTGLQGDGSTKALLTRGPGDDPSRHPSESHTPEMRFRRESDLLRPYPNRRVQFVICFHNSIAHARLRREPTPPQSRRIIATTPVDPVTE